MRPATDFDMLGRLGTADRPLTGGTRRRRQADGPAPARPSLADVLASIGVSGVRPPRLLVVAVVGIMLVLGGIGAAVNGQSSVLSAVTLTTPSMDPALQATLLAGETPEVSTGSISLVPGGGSAAGTVGAPSPFAAVDDLAIHLPAVSAESVVFLEADTPSALPLAPVGTMVANDNPEGFVEPQPLQGPEYVVGRSRTGVRPATGQAALLLAPGTVLTAPVQGTVDAVEQYTTETGELDWQVLIRPQGRSDLHVVMRRIDVAFVSPGDAVTVGRTQIGTVRAGAVLDVDTNPLAFPSALLLVQPAVLSGGLNPTASAVPAPTG